MKKAVNKKIILAAFIVPLAIALTLVAWLWSTPFSRLLASNYAKELCSCLFVSQLPAGHCEEYATQFIKVSGHNIELGQKTVKAWGWGREAQAKWLGPRLGCQLQNVE